MPKTSGRDNLPREPTSAYPGIGPDESCALYRLIAECATDFICILSRRGEIIYASPSAEPLFGYAPGDLVARCVAELVHPEDLGKIPAEFPVSGPPPRVDLRIRCASGTHRWMECAGRPIIQGESVTGYACVLRDAAGRHAREEELLRQHEVLDSTQDGFLAFDAEGRILTYNRSFHRLWQLRDDEVATVEPGNPGARGRLLELEADRTEDRNEFLAWAGPLVREPRLVVNREVALADGSALELYSVPTHDAAGRHTGRIAFYRDVTARRRAERELRVRARQQAAVAALGEIAIATERFEDLVDIALRLARSTLGADLGELVLAGEGGALTMAGSIGWARPFPELDRKAPSQAAFTLARSEPVVAGDLAAEARFQDPLLLAHGMVSSLTVVVPGKSRHLGVLGVHSHRRDAFGIDDVHLLETVASILAAAAARQEVEEALARQERELRAVFDASLDGMLIVDRAGQVMECNPAACVIFELPRNRLLGQPPPGMASDGSGLLGGVAAGGRREGALELSVPGQPPRNLEFATVPDILPGRHLVVLRDITEQKQLQARLAFADRMISVGTLAAGVAHELNNPLAYISANLSFVAEKLGELGGATGQGEPPPKELDEALSELLMAAQEAREGSERMRVIIRDLGTFSRGEEATRGPVQLGPVLESCIGMAWNEIKHRATLVKAFGEVPPVEGSAARLGQVFLNLLVNAAQAIPEGGAEKNQIRVGTRLLPDGRVAVEVADTGCGIPPENQRRIFDPFFTTKGVGEGTGLGLSICHNIVMAHGGEVEVESTLGVGTTFRVILNPAQGTLPDGEHQVVALVTGARRGSVLVVDDEPMVGAAVRRTLLPEHDVTVVSSARAALELIGQGERFDLVISDVLMPDMTGMDLHRELALLGADVAPPVIFLTGGAFTPAARRFVEGPGIDCIEKPFEVAALRDKVRACLR